MSMETQQVTAQGALHNIVIILWQVWSRVKTLWAGKATLPHHTISKQPLLLTLLTRVSCFHQCAQWMHTTRLKKGDVRFIASSCMLNITSMTVHWWEGGQLISYFWANQWIVGWFKVWKEQELNLPSWRHDCQIKRMLNRQETYINRCKVMKQSALIINQNNCFKYHLINTKWSLDTLDLKTMWPNFNEERV